MTIKNIITTDLSMDFQPMGFYLENLSWLRDPQTNSISYFLRDQKLWTDKGNSYEFESLISDEAIHSGLTLARGKFGRKLLVSGNSDFLQQIAYVAATNPIDIEFINDDLAALIKNTKKEIARISEMSPEEKTIHELLQKKSLTEKPLVPTAYYVGEILLIGKDKIVHKISYKDAVVHDKEAVMEEMPSLELGDRIEVRYRGGRISNVTFLRPKNQKANYRAPLGRG